VRSIPWSSVALVSSFITDRHTAVVRRSAQCPYPENKRRPRSLRTTGGRRTCKATYPPGRRSSLFRGTHRLYWSLCVCRPSCADKDEGMRREGRRTPQSNWPSGVSSIGPTCRRFALYYTPFPSLFISQSLLLPWLYVTACQSTQYR